MGRVIETFEAELSEVRRRILGQACEGIVSKMQYAIHLRKDDKKGP
jgi:hypothetical protein